MPPKSPLNLTIGEVSQGLGLGTASFGDKIQPTKDAVVAAIKAGYRHIDGAWAYTTEREVGEDIKEATAQGLVEREDLLVTTKVSRSFAHDPERSWNESLEKLQLDYVDLVLLSL